MRTDIAPTLAPVESVIRAAARTLLDSLRDPERRSTTLALLRPTDDDVDRAFAPRVAPRARAVYRAFHASSPGLIVDARPLVAVASAESLDRPRPGFPDGYVDVAPYLRIGVHWTAWIVLADDGTLRSWGDGLAYLGGRRWAWLPHPWIALSTVAT